MDLKKLALLNTLDKIHLKERDNIVLISLKVDGSIPTEFHRESQLFYCVQGDGIVKIGSRLEEIKEGYAVVVDGMEDHTIINIGKNELKLWSMYF